MLYLLDTDHFSLLYRRSAPGLKIQERLRLLSPDDYGISIVTYVESTKGWLAEIARAETPEQEVLAFAAMQNSFRFCTAFALWEYTAEAATKSAELKSQKIRVGPQDRKIASIALVNNATLLTRNTQDFERIPHLLFADWSISQRPERQSWLGTHSPVLRTSPFPSPYFPRASGAKARGSDTELSAALTEPPPSRPDEAQKTS
jgi:tRNA(fMet)-specific endonuclease VapC